MATYAELNQLFGQTDLRNKVRVACIVAAETIRIEPPATPNHVNRLLWAKAVFASPEACTDSLLMATLAANRSLPVASIVGASDAAIQAAVDAAVDIFAIG